MRIFVLAAFLSIAQAVDSATLDLVCTAQNGFSVVLQIDENANSVIMNSTLKAERVSITKDRITYATPFSGGNRWFHTINRTTGTLLVSGEDKIDSRYECERSAPKF